MATQDRVGRMTKTPAPTPDAILQALPSGITAIEAANSLEFLRAAFDCYDKGQVFAITRADVDPARYGVPVTTQHHDSETRGWGQLGHSISHSEVNKRNSSKAVMSGRGKGGGVLA